MFFFFFIQLFYILFLFLFFFSSFYFLFFDFCLFIIKPYLHFFSSLISNYFFFTSSNLPLMHYYKQNYIKICFNVILQHEEVYSYAIPDFLFVEYNPFFSLGIYLFIFFLLLFLYFFFYSSLSILFVWFGCIRILLYYLLFHYVLVPFKLFQLSYDFLELETLFNLQFSINYYFMFYFVCLFLFILFMEFPFYFSLKYFIKRLLYIFILLLSFYVYDPFNFSYFTLNVNGYSFIYSYVICLILLEIFIFLNNVFIKLEMTGIEPA